MNPKLYVKLVYEKMEEVEARRRMFNAHQEEKCLICGNSRGTIPCPPPSCTIPQFHHLPIPVGH